MRDHYRHAATEIVQRLHVDVHGWPTCLPQAVHRGPAEAAEHGVVEFVGEEQLAEEYEKVHQAAC